jgi:protease IV
MKRLVRWLLRTVAMVILLLLLAAVSDYLSHRVQTGSVLLVTMQGPVVERGRTGIGGLIGAGRETPLNLVRQALDKAARDDRIAGVALKLIDPEMELAQAQELATHVHSVASHGKWTVAYLETAGELEPGNLPYLVASAAGEVSMMPEGELNLIGVGLREIFARGTLDWVGIRPDFEAIGAYKSAMNVFTEKDFTPAQREEDEALVSDLYEQLVGQIASQRRLKPDAVRAIIDRAPLTAESGLKAHLLDRLEYEDQFNDRIKNYRGRQHKLVDYASYVRPRILPELKTYSKIAVIYGDGDIERGAGGVEPGANAVRSDKMAAAFKAAREDDSVKAVVFRINSPGGSVLGSEMIRREAELTAGKKPLLVSMSGYGASGGYWIATPSRRIFADPGTITGSIGVLAGKFNAAPMAQKFGINTGAITRGANFTMFDGFTDFTAPQQRIIREQVLGETYQRFLRLVANSRHLTVEQVNQVAQGRVWTGEQAAKVKLVDQLGGLDAALDAAKAAAKLAPGVPVEVVELPEQPGVLEQVLGGDLDARVSVSPGARLLRPWNWLVRTALARSGAFGAAYCPLAPLM